MTNRVRLVIFRQVLGVCRTRLTTLPTAALAARPVGYPPQQ